MRIPGANFCYIFQIDLRFWRKIGDWNAHNYENSGSQFLLYFSDRLKILEKNRGLECPYGPEFHGAGWKGQNFGKQLEKSTLSLFFSIFSNIFARIAFYFFFASGHFQARQSTHARGCVRQKQSVKLIFFREPLRFFFCVF